MSRKFAPPPTTTPLKWLEDYSLCFEFPSTQTGERLGEKKGEVQIPHSGAEARSRHSWHALMRGSIELVFLSCY